MGIRPTGLPLGTSVEPIDMTTKKNFLLFTDKSYGMKFLLFSFIFYELRLINNLEILVNERNQPLLLIKIELIIFLNRIFQIPNLTTILIIMIYLDSIILTTTFYLVR